MAENTQAENGTQKAKRNYGPKVPVDVTVSQILDWLESGETRADIAAKLGLNLGQVNALFASSDKLKGKKTKKDLSKSFNLIDDTVDGETGTANQPTQETQEQQPQQPQPAQPVASWE